jgi:hypothetical protein
VTWDPLARQEAEPDTLYLFDVETEAARPAWSGGLTEFGVASRAAPGWKAVATVPGKYRTGIQCLSRTNGYLTVPLAGLLDPDEFTIEMWLRSAIPWSQVSDNVVFAAGSGTEIAGLFVRVTGGQIQVSLRTGAPVTLTYYLTVPGQDLPAGVWESVAVTYAGGVLQLYVNGVAVAMQSGVATPALGGETGAQDQISLLGVDARGADEFSLSDLRISRTARVPGQAVTLRAEDTLTVHADQPTGEIVRQSLLGGLHTLKGPATEAMAAGVLQVLRTDKMLSATPIVAGPPDSTHPTPGVSARFAYDWQVVDRTLDYYQRLGITPYISIDSTPQILGGSQAPLQNGYLRTYRSFQADFAPEVPSDLDAFGAMVRDLVYHVTKEKGAAVPYWSVWNEPNEPGFWKGTRDEYFQLYAVCAAAVKSVDPALKVGGPEIKDFDRAWIDGLIASCARGHVLLDFIAWHYYSGTVGDIAAAREHVDAVAAQNGLPAPEMLIGEWCWSLAALPQSTATSPLWGNGNDFLNDWHAAFVGVSLIAMQRSGVIYSIYTNPVAEAGQTSYSVSGLMSSTHPWANLNVYRIWAKLKPSIVAADLVAVPSISALASRDESGGLTVLLASALYHEDADRTVTVKLPDVALSAHVTAYVVDDRHSNYFQAGAANADLETVPAVLQPDPVPPSKSTVLRVTMRPRSVILLVVRR